MLPPPVHLVTDRRATPDLVRAVRSAVRSLPPHSVAVHLREKDLGGAELLALARSIAAECRAARQLLVVNDRIDVALASGADGVHLPAAGVPPGDARRLLGEGRLLGVSCHGEDDVRRALAGSADYAFFSPIFDTPSKRACGRPLGVGALRAAASVGLPLIALGGVDAGNAASVVEAGARGVAAIRAWLASADPGRATAALLEAAGGSRHHHGHRPQGHQRHGLHGNPEDLDAYVARMESEDRQLWQRPDEVLAALRLEPGDTVADIGAGPGYFTLRLARAVGALGCVYAVDVVPEMIATLRHRLDGARLGNVRPVLARDDDPLLPPAALDRILLVNTFHHFPDGVAYLRLLASRLKPDGLIVDVDFHKRELPVGPPVEHKVSREDFLGAAAEAGLAPVEEITSLPYQYLVVLRPIRTPAGSRS